MTSTLSFLRERITRAPSALVILGSGLGPAAERIQDPVEIPYGEIPGFPPATVTGHAGRLIAGILNGVEVLAMQGRFHLYEGRDPAEVVLPVRVAAALGVRTLVVSNAAGGVRPGMAAGDLMLISDHLNLTGRNPLIGAVVPGEQRFPDMSEPYDGEYRRIARETALELGIPLEEGVYAGLLGPNYETPAEVRMLRTLGADAVGMSTVSEVIVARALGLRVLGISLISNLAAGLAPGTLSHDEVMEAGERVAGRFTHLLHELLPRLAPSNLPTEAAS